METNDDALVEKIRSGDSQALGTLYRRHAGSALAVAVRIVGDRDAAEDVVHDTFVAAWENIDRFHPSRGSARAWILAIARNRAIDRRRAVRPSIEAADADAFALLRTGADPTLEEVLGRLQRGELRDAIDTLPDEQRRAIDLAYFAGHTYREIAALTGVPEGTANGRLSRALAKLRERLAHQSAAPVPIEGAVLGGAHE